MSSIFTAEELLRQTREALLAIGYREPLVLQDYSFAEVFGVDTVRQINLAAFAQDPPSYRNACFGVAVLNTTHPVEVQRFRALGAPQILSFHPSMGEVRRWKMVARGEPELIERIDPARLGAAIREREAEWNPTRVFRAKAIKFDSGPVQLDFFDVGLLPILEDVVHKKLDRLLRDVIASTKAVYNEQHESSADYVALFRLIFRLIAAKLLADRQYPGRWGDSDVQIVLQAVENFYFQRSNTEHILQDREVQQVAWNHLRSAFHFQNLSVEALAYVYENTLVNPETRTQFNTHATRHDIAEYVLRQLPLEKLSAEERQIFEPFAGHAPFLIAALSQLRLLLPSDIDAKQRHDYLTHMLSGMEIDAFACEVARYSLMLADYPNPNGWQITNADVFASPLFDAYLKQAKVVLCNPPYGDFTSAERRENTSITSPNKAVEALRRVLQYSPKMIGFVLPRVFIEGQSYRQARRDLASLYSNIDIVALPDVAFQFSEAETVLLIAHGERSNRLQVRSAMIEKQDYQRFVRTGEPTWQTVWSASSSIDGPAPVLWRGPLHRVWDSLRHLPHLATLVDVHRGIEFNVPLKENASRLVSDVPRSDFLPGLMRVSNDFEPYSILAWKYINIDPTLMRGNAYTRPWKEPKVIANAVRLSRGPWRIAGAIDTQGLICYQNFQGLWPISSVPGEVIAALLNGPVANAYVSAHGTSMHNQVAVIKDIPVPQFTPDQIRKIVSLVQDYQLYRRQWVKQETLPSDFERICGELIRKIDAEILAAYNIPPRIERELLDYFAGHKRPGPVLFEYYFPPNFRPAIPWHVYISDEFQYSSARRTIERLPVIYDPLVSEMIDQLDQ